MITPVGTVTIIGGCRDSSEFGFAHIYEMRSTSGGYVLVCIRCGTQQQPQPIIYADSTTPGR